MLVLHSDSRCDVCLCEFVADMSSKSPHAIACGHIFCRDCLYSNTPPLCPLCRKAYLPNKMKKLHVDRPEEVDDRKEVDLLQRLVLSWDTPHEQLQQVVDEVDAWLATRDEDSCISLRKARTTLERHKALKVSETDLRNVIPQYEEEMNRLAQENYMAKEQAAMQIQIHEETHRTQLRELTKELAGWKTRYKNEPRPSPAPGYGSYGATRNPLPHPPVPISTDQVPTIEQVLTQSGANTRYSELPADSPQYRYEPEGRSRRHRPSEERYSSYTAHTPASSSSNHYVQPHVSPSHEYRSPPHMSSADPHQPLQVQFHSGRPLDVYGLTSELIHGYGVGFAQAQRSALRNHHNDVIGPPLYADPNPPRTTAQSTTAYIEEVENSNVYASQPQSASSGSSNRRRNRRHSTHQSSIASSSPSHGHGVERRLPSRSRSRSSSRGPTPSASSHSRSARSHRAEVTNPHPAAAPEVTNTSRPLSGRASTPVSMISHATVSSNNTWGTIWSNMTEGDFPELGVRLFRDPELPTYAPSARTRNSSISDMSSLGLGLASEAAPAASPARAVGNMTGVLPPVEDPDLSASALSEAETVRQQSYDARASHRSATALDQREHYGDSYRSGYSSTARLPEHDEPRYRLARRGRASSSTHRSSTAVDPRVHRADYDAPPPSLPHRSSDHSSYGRLGRSGQPLRPSDTLPVESPGFPVSVEYTTEEDADYFRRHDISSADTTSFTGNALGLELTSSGEISAPAPIVPSNSMMRTWSDHNRN